MLKILAIWFRRTIAWLFRPPYFHLPYLRHQAVLVDLQLLKLQIHWRLLGDRVLGAYEPNPDLYRILTDVTRLKLVLQDVRRAIRYQIWRIQDPDRAFLMVDRMGTRRRDVLLLQLEEWPRYAVELEDLEEDLDRAFMP